MNQEPNSGEPENTPRRRRSKEERAAIISAFLRSGQTRQAFCLENGLCAATLANWLREHRSSALSGFQRVHVSGPRGTGRAPSIRTPEGIEIFPGEGAGVEDLVGIVQALRRSSC